MERENLFGDELPPMWEEDWQGMPEYKNKDLSPVNSIVVNFYSVEAIAEFSKLVNQKITSKTRFINFPVKEDNGLRGYVYKSDYT
jgi:hypothetical protein